MSKDVLDISNCILCPRKCGVNRTTGQLGYCGQNSAMKVARAALHHWEEPCISGKNGSGAVFFSGCNMRCIFCQNAELSSSKIGKDISASELSDIFLMLQDQGAHNINLVTPGHFVYDLIPAIDMAKAQGLSIPIVYNTGSYERVETLKRLEGLIDIYLPDLKFYSSKLSLALSNAQDYFEVAMKAILEMFGQTGECIFDEEGMMKKGIILRHLVLPGHVNDSRELLGEAYRVFGDKIFFSIMNQFTPMPSTRNMHDLGHTLKSESYDRLIDYCISIGIKNAFIQEGETCKESFIPKWDFSGLPG